MITTLQQNYFKIILLTKNDYIITALVWSQAISVQATVCTYYTWWYNVFKTEYSFADDTFYRNANA